MLDNIFLDFIDNFIFRDILLIICGLFLGILESKVIELLGKFIKVYEGGYWLNIKVVIYDLFFNEIILGFIYDWDFCCLW